MMRSVIILLVLVFGTVSCKHDTEPFSEPTTQLTLKWNQSYPTETKENVLLGLNWALANLGARNTIESANGFTENTNKLVGLPI